MTQEEKKKLIDWIHLNLESFLHFYDFNWDGSERYERCDLDDDEFEINWVSLEKGIMKEL